MSFTLGVDTDNSQISSAASDGKTGSWNQSQHDVVFIIGDILVAKTGAVLKVDSLPSDIVLDYSILLGTTLEIQEGFEYPLVWRVVNAVGGVDNSDEYYYYDNGGLYPWVPVGTPAPVFSVQPSNQVVTEPDAAVFGPVAASDTDTWQWEAESSPGVWANAETVLLNATGQTTDTLNTGATVDADDTGVRVKASGAGGTTTSTEVSLTVTAAGGGNFVATFNASAEGFTITRASDQTGLAVDGIIYTSAANLGVYPGAANSAGWQPDASFKGLLLEGAGENIFSAPTDFSSWSVNSGTRALNETTGPSGLVDADLYTEDTATSEHGFNISWATPTAITSIQVCAKYTDLQFVGWRLNANGWGNAKFDIVNNVFHPQGLTQYDGAYLDVLANGWDLLAFTTTAPPGNASFSLRGFDQNDGGLAGEGQTYTGTSRKVNWWGIQAEEHAFPTSLMLSTTRATTTCSQTLANMGITPPTNNFSVAVEFELIADRQYYRDDEFCIFELAATSTNRLRLYFDSANDNLVAQKVVNGTPGTAVTHDISDLLRGVVMSVLVEVQSPGGLTLTIDAVQEGNAAGETSDFAAALDTFYLGHNVVGGDNHFAVVKTLTIEPSI